MTEPRLDALRGRRPLVVEDEYMVATDPARALEERGADVVGPVGLVEDALELVAGDDRLDGAVLDINLRGERAYPVADALRERGAPFVFATGCDGWVIPDAYADAPRAEKPVDARALARLLSGAKRQHP